AMSGRVLRGAARTLTLSVEDGLLDVGDVVEATLSFESNGGDASMAVSYTVGSGIGQCGAYLPPESGRTGPASAVTRARLDAERGTTPRTAVPGAGAREVPGEILVAYHDDGLLTQGAVPPRAELAAATGMALVRAGSAGVPDLYRAADPAMALELLLADPRVRYAHRNYYLEPQHV